LKTRILNPLKVWLIYAKIPDIGASYASASGIYFVDDQTVAFKYIYFFTFCRNSLHFLLNYVIITAIIEIKFSFILGGLILGNILGSILIIENSSSIKPKLLASLEKSYSIHVAENAQQGLDIIRSRYIDIFIIMSDDCREPFTEQFLKKLEEIRSEVVQVIFLSKTRTEIIQEKANHHGWFSLENPAYKEFIETIQRAMRVAIALDNRTFTIEKTGELHHYRERDVLAIKRSKDRYIKIYNLNPITFVREVEEFPFDRPLGAFPKRYGIEKYFEQSQQSWIVNVSKIKKVDKSKHVMEISLVNGMVVPTSKNFVHKFLVGNEEEEES